MAAFFNFVAFFVFQLSVATTIGHGIIDQGIVDHYVIFGALIGAIAWNLITWWYGIPSSSSHALIGGLVGAAVAKAGTWALVPAGILKTIAFIFIAPLLGMVLGAAADARRVVALRARHARARRPLVPARCSSSRPSLYSLGHGGNDAQKTIGIIWMLLIAAGYLGDAGPGPDLGRDRLLRHDRRSAPLFGGWRIVKTMGQRITKLKPVGGFCAETGGAAMLFLATGLGIPVSTTHTITGAIVGVGSAQNASAVRWGVAGDIVWAWVLTIPCSAFVAGVAWWLGRLLFSS